LFFGGTVRALRRQKPLNPVSNRRSVCTVDGTEKQNRNKNIMKCNQWTVALIGAGLVSLPAVTHAEEQVNQVLTALSATTLSGYVNTAAQWVARTGKNNTNY